MTEPLFACTKCHSRHPFEELSQAEQFCKNCRSNYPVVKCTYCRAEFQQSKGSATTICKKCSHNVKLYGKPSACEYCSILAAFTGPHCHRCMYNELKHGSPQTCEQCKLTCAFNKNDESTKKVGGKLLCWLCTLAYKRVLAKTRRHRDHSSRSSKPPGHEASLNDSRQSRQEVENAGTTTATASENTEASSAHHRHHRHPHKTHKSRHHLPTHMSDDQGTPSKRIKVDTAVSAEASPASVTKVGVATTSASIRSTSSLSTVTTVSSSERSFMELGSADHMIAITQLREQLEATKKVVEAKDKMILEKEKKITEIKAHQYEIEKEFRTKLAKIQTDWEERQESLLSKNRDLQKLVKTLKDAKGKKLGTNSPML